MAKSNKTHWSRRETSDLICVYRNHSVLWDTRRRDYNDLKKSVIALCEMADKFQTSSGEIRKKLNSLRHQVGLEMTKVKKRPLECGTEEVYITTWAYFEELFFLIPHFTDTPKDHQSNFSENDSKLLVSGSFDAAEVNFIPRPEWPRKNPLESHPFEPYDYESTFPPLIKGTDPRDEYVIFGEYVASELKALHLESNKRRLKNDIRKAICAIADSDFNKHQTNFCMS